MLKLNRIRSLKAARIHPEIRKLVLSSLVGAKLELFVGFLCDNRASFQVLEGDFVFIFSPSVRQNDIWRDLVLCKFGQAELAICIRTQQPHIGGGYVERVDVFVGKQRKIQQ
jgi:hypothetical protein